MSYFRAAAGRVGMTITDLEVIELLAGTGPMTAGQLAELTGLTTGAITGMLNRLEEARLVRRERDPADARRVIVHLTPETEAMRELEVIFDSAGQAWTGLAMRYDDEQLAVLVDFLRRGNALSQQETGRLREASGGQEDVFSAPLGDVTSGQLVVSGVARLAVRAGGGMSDLCRARFEGPVPEVKAKDGAVTIRYPRRLWMLSGEQRVAEVALNAAIPWKIAIKGGASEIIGELGGLNLSALEVSGGMSLIRLELPEPAGVVPIRISGGVSDITVKRPAGVATRAHLTGWVSTFIFDDQLFSNVGNDVRLQSPGSEAASQRYDIEIASSASMVTITTR